MNRWQALLNSLATRGGNILVLSFFSVLFLIVDLNLMLAGIEGRSAQVIETVFTGAFGALTGILTGGLSKQRSGDSESNGVKRNGQK